MSDRDVNINVNVGLNEAKLDLILHRIDVLTGLVSDMKERIMATLADVQAAVTAEDTVVDSAIALLQGLAAQIAALTPDQAAIDALAADVTAKTSTLAAAVAANTPAAKAP